MPFSDLFWWVYKQFHRKVRSRLPIRVRGRRYRPLRYTGPFTDGLWGEIERAFAYSKGDGVPRDQLNRRAREEAGRLGILTLPFLTEESCTVALEDWPISRLATLYRAHDLDRPRSDKVPVIVLVAGSHAVLLDGFTRVNKWSKKLDTGTRPVIVITLLGPFNLADTTKLQTANVCPDE
jgi:hypothetical protein